VRFQARDRVRGVVACDRQQIVRQWLGRCGLSPATAAERIQQWMTSEVLEPATAAQKAAEPMGHEVMVQGV